MEGRGVTNYNPEKPSYGFSTATTEFDDALMERGIVAFEQAMMAKGASPSEAHRLAELHAHAGGSSDGQAALDGKNDSSRKQQLGDGHDDEVSDASSDEGENENDEQFIQKYRQMRLNEMKKGRLQEYGDVIPISKPDWNREVNGASNDGLWVVVNLTRSTASNSIAQDELCDKVEDVTKDLADSFVNIKFVSIPSTSAIENWPSENLPTLFCYRYGKLQHQLIGIDSMGGPGVNSGRLEWRLSLLGVLETGLEEDPRPDKIGVSTDKGKSGSQFGGGMSRLATTRDYESDDSYNDVD